MIARAKRDALRSAVFDEWVERRIYAERSLAQMIRASHRWAMIPLELAAAWDVTVALDRLIDDDGYVDGRFGNLCAAQMTEEGITWVCLVARCPARDSGDPYAHAWPTAEVRLAAALALYEQTDPLARIERRVAAALGEASDHPLVAAFAADMPSA